MAWKKVLFAGDAELEIEALTTLALTGDLTVISAGKFINTINLKTPAPTELTIASGAITRTQMHHKIDTQADASSDDLDTIAGGAEGLLLLMRPENDGRTVVVRHNQGAGGGSGILLANGENFTMDGITDTLLLIYDSALDTLGAWREISRSAVAAATLSNTTPTALTNQAATAGDDGDASRADHVHALGPLTAALDHAQTEAIGFRFDNASAAPNSGTEVEGQAYYDTDDDHVYVWTS
jgi:hypothetical protein